MHTFTVTPEEFTNGTAARKALDLFRNRNLRKPRPKLPPPARLDFQIGTITPEQFARGNAYGAEKRRLGHRQTPSTTIKPVAESIVDALLL
jgi:hypothetical protein